MLFQVGRLYDIMAQGVGAYLGYEIKYVRNTSKIDSPLRKLE